MICIKCGKKIEYETTECKYCKEPVVMEGCSPMGDIASIAAPVRSLAMEPAVPFEARMHTGGYVPHGVSVKKFIPLIVGGACTLALLVGLLIWVIMPGEEQVTPIEEPKTVDEIYDSLYDEVKKSVEEGLESSEDNDSPVEGNPPDELPSTDNPSESKPQDGINTEDINSIQNPKIREDKPDEEVEPFIPYLEE